MKKKLLRTNLHLKTLLTISTATVASFAAILTGIFLSIAYTRVIRTTAIETADEITKQVNNNLDHYISDILSVASYAHEVARTTGDLTIEDVAVRLQTLIESRNDLQRVAVFDQEGNVIATTTPDITLSEKEISNEEWFEKALNGEGKFFFTGPRIQNLSSYSDEEIVLSYSTLLKFIYQNNDDEDQGILLINLNFNAISDIIDKAVLPVSGFFYIINEDGNIIYKPKVSNFNQVPVKDGENGSFIKKIEGEEKLIIVEDIDNTTWRIVGVSLLDELMRPVSRFTYLILIVLFIILVLTFVIGNLVGNSVARPIKELEKTMREVQKGNFEVSPPEGGTIETQSLATSFSITIEKIRELMEDIRRSEKIKRQRELEALQAKINPHFLYNTLDTMIWMAETGDKAGVVKMATSLANLFRISTAKGHDIITLQEELQHVKNYLDIQMMRYKDKFSYEIDLPEELNNKPTIKLIVQPIVENAIYHGIKYLTEKGEIKISVWRSSGGIKIRVKDTGIGMREDVASSLLSDSKPDKEDANSHGMGLKNIDERIKLTYGSGYGLTVKSEPDEGTEVTIFIPDEKEIKAVVLKKQI